MIQDIRHKSKVLGHLISINTKNSGLKFYTPPSLAHQVAFMKYNKNHYIKPHTHFKRIRKNINITSEVLLITKGKLRVDFYLSNKKYIFSKIISKNQILILLDQGHGFKVLSPLEMIELKQGPYSKKIDKKLFLPVKENFIKFK
jgi:hypothetical protein